MQKETNIERRLREGVKRLGGLCLKIQRLTGYPDRIVVLPGGRHVWVELKRPTGKVAEHQRLAHRDLRNRGAEVVVLWSNEHVDAWLSEVMEDD